MKRKALLLTLLMLIGFGMAKAGEDVQIGHYKYGWVSDNFPVGIRSCYSLTQQIYTASELKRAGSITSISFYHVWQDVSVEELLMTDLKVYMKHVSKTTFSGDDAVPVSDEDLVWSGTFSTPKREYQGWVTISLDQAFDYNGTDNLLICFYDDNPERTIGSTNRFAFDSSQGNAIVYYTVANTPAPDLNDLSTFGYSTTGSCPMIKVHFGEEKVEIGTPLHSYGNLPTTTEYNYAISQQILTKAELGSARTFNSISFYNEGVGRFRVVDLYIVPTNKEEFSINVESDSGDNSTDWLNFSEDYLVFSGEAAFANNSWSTITFDTPYEYDGSSNVAIIMNDRTGSFVGSAKFRTISSDDVSIYAYNDDDAYTSNGLGSVIGTVVTYRNLIKINEEEIQPKDIRLPTYTYYNYALSQQIYTSTEIGSAKDLTSVSFFNAGDERTRDIDIYLVPTSKDYFNSKTAWETVTEADKLFSGVVTFEKNRWTAIAFNKAYQYSGTGNLALVVDDNTGIWKSGVPFLTFQATEQSLYAANDGDNYDPLNMNGYNGTVLSVKNQIRFNEKGLTVPNATNLTVSDIEWNSATVTWEGDAETYNLQYRINGNGEWKSKYAIEGKSYTLTGLEERKEYEVRVQINGYGSNDWISTTFSTSERFLAPSNVEIVAVTPYTAVVTWNDNCGASQWRVSLGGSPRIATSKPFIVTGLRPDTNYDLSVCAIMEVDGEELYSPWTDYINFTTPVPNPAPTDIAVTTTPSSASISWEGQSDSYKVHYKRAPDTFFFEDFEGDVSGWIAKDFNSSGGIFNYGLEDSRALAFHYTTTPPQYVVSPELSGITDATVLEFYYRNSSSAYPESFKVGYSMTTNDLDDASAFTWSEEFTVDADEDWHLYTQALPAGVKYISIQCTSDDMYYFIVDNIIIYKETGEEWQTVETTDKEVTIEGLDSNTEYQFNVVGVMYGQEDVSAGINTFTTMESNPVPYDIVVNAYASSADLSWKGYSDSYIVTYKPIEENVTSFFDDFESGDLSTKGWTVYTNGESPFEEGWNMTTPSGAYSGTYAATARSWYDNVAYDADNWLITPPIELGGRLTFYHKVNATYPDSYAVLLSTTTMETSAFTTELRPLQPAYASEYWTEINIDLSDYAGQTGYIAIRHKDKDEDWLEIDDFTITSKKYGQQVNTMVSGTEFTMVNLTPDTKYEVQITGFKEGEPDAVSETFSFTTLSSDPIDIYLDNNSSNSYDIASFNGTLVNASIYNLTLQSGVWTGICLPFDVDVENSVLAGSDVRTLESSGMIDQYYALNCLTPLTFMEHGKPYIIRWNGASDLIEPVFKGVVINNASSGISASGVFFYPAYYDAYTVNSHRPDYYLTTGDGYCGVMSQLIGTEHRAFDPEFYIPYGTLPYDTTPVVLNTGDNVLIDGITALKSETDDVIFNVAGQKLNKVQRGVNIVNGKKVLVK